VTGTASTVIPASRRGKRAEVELVVAIIAASLVVIIVRMVLVQPFLIPSASMEPSLYQGDYVIVSTMSYGLSRHSIPFSPPLFNGRLLNRAPRRGDIVVFKLPREAATTRVDYIKRLIGLPGDQIQLKHGLIYINNAPVVRKPAASGVEDDGDGVTQTVTRYWETLPGGRQFLTNSYGDDSAAENTGTYVVPPRCYFVLGDNRDNSLDSRFDPAMPAGMPASATCAWDNSLDKFVPDDAGVGFVPEEDLIGRARLVLFSAKPGVSPLDLKSWVSAFRADRVLHWLK